MQNNIYWREEYRKGKVVNSEEERRDDITQIWNKDDMSS